MMPETAGEILRKLFSFQRIYSEKFEAASNADFVKEDISLEEPYKVVTALRLNKTDFLVQHLPSTLINKWSAKTGPKSLKEAIVGFVDLCKDVVPSIEKTDVNNG